MTKRVYFVDGFSSEDGTVGIVTYLHELASKDVEFTRFYLAFPPYKNSDWGHRHINHDIVSLTYHDGAWWLLGKRGVVFPVIPKTDATEEEIPEAGTGPGKYGYLNKIRRIGDDLYVCGYLRQVYKRSSGKWVAIDKDIRAAQSENGVGFYGIDGTGPDDIYTVGRKGEIFYYNGRKWQKIESPTNILLRSVCCVSPNLVYICGEKGTVLRGYRNSWEVIQNDTFEENLYAVEYFKDVPYFAYKGGLVCLKNDELVPVETSLQTEIDGSRLHANEDILWSFGDDHIVNFDGKKWQEIICPDNNY